MQNYIIVNTALKSVVGCKEESLPRGHIDSSLFLTNNITQALFFRNRSEVNRFYKYAVKNYADAQDQYSVVTIPINAGYFKEILNFIAKDSGVSLHYIPVFADTASDSLKLTMCYRSLNANLYAHQACQHTDVQSLFAVCMSESRYFPDTRPLTLKVKNGKVESIRSFIDKEN